MNEVIGVEEIITRFQLFRSANNEGVFSFFMKINVLWKVKIVSELSLELETLVQETVLECFFKNGMHCLLVPTGEDYMLTKIKSNVSEDTIFQFSKYGDSAICTLYLLCIFTSMVGEFKSFNAGQKIFLTKI